MAKLSSEGRLVAVTGATVAVIFCALVTLLFFSSGERALENELKEGQEALNRNVELLEVMLRDSMTVAEVSEVAERPWADGTGAFVVTPVDSFLPAPGGSHVLSAVVTCNGKELFRVNQIFSVSELMEPVKTPLRNFLLVSALTLLLLVLAVRFSILRVSRPEILRRERLDAELSVAERIQRGLTPCVDSRTPAGVDAVAFLQPAKEVAGDFYNLLTVGTKVHFIVGDVSGKGVPAALFMVVTEKLFTAAANKDLPSASIARRLNEELCRDNPEAMFGTAVIGRLDLTDGTLEVCNAGHTAPLLSLPGEKPRFLRITPCLPLGVLSDAHYEAHVTSLRMGECVLLYTDGVTEAQDRKGALLGQEGLLQALAAAAPLTAAEVVRAVTDSCARHAAGASQTDDIAMLALRLTARTLPLRPQLSELGSLYAFAAAAGLPDRLMLALEEAVVNVITHADATSLAVCCSNEGGLWTVIITDDGIPFDPTAPAPSSGVAIDGSGDILIGGQGLNLINSIAESVDYQRLDNKNILTIKYTDKK